MKRIRNIFKSIVAQIKHQSFYVMCILCYTAIILVNLQVQSMQAQAGEITRSYKAKADFAKINPCPSTHKPKTACPGYVIDHIQSLDCGGADNPSNMQWQTVQAAKEKDKWERNGPECKHRTHGVKPPETTPETTPEPTKPAN